MKKILYFIFTILLITSVNALVAGSNNTILTLNKCNDLFVNVTGELVIDDGEYNFPNCHVLEDNYWYCECYDNYNLTISLHVQTLNNYTFNISYYEETKQQQIVTRSGRGGTTIRENNTIINETDELPIVDVEGNETDELPIVDVEGNETTQEQELTEETEDVLDKESETPPIVEEPKPIPWWVFILVGLVLLLIIFIGILIIRKSAREDGDDKLY